MRTFSRTSRSFTLVELLIVIAIIGILAGAVLFATGDSTSNAQDTVAKADLARVRTVATSFYIKNNLSYDNSGTGGKLCNGFDGITSASSGKLKDEQPLKVILEKYSEKLSDSYAISCAADSDDWAVSILKLPKDDAIGSASKTIDSWCISADNPNVTEIKIRATPPASTGQKIVNSLVQGNHQGHPATCITLTPGQQYAFLIIP